MNRIKATLEAQQADIQTARGEFERKSKKPEDKIAVKAHRKAGIDLGRRASKEYQEMAERATVSYVEKPKPKVTGGIAQKAHRNIPRKGKAVGGAYLFEGEYATREEANAIKRAYRSNGFFVTVRPLKGGGYSVWIKEGFKIGGKRKKAEDTRIEPHPYDLFKDVKTVKGQNRIIKAGAQTVGRTVANLTDLGTLPKYQPPNFQISRSGYKPLEYKQVGVKQYQYSGYKPIAYKPVSTEPMFKSFQPYQVKQNEPYYRKSEYVPIGEFGVKGNWAKKRKHKKLKAKRARLVGVK